MMSGVTGDGEIYVVGVRYNIHQLAIGQQAQPPHHISNKTGLVPNKVVQFSFSVQYGARQCQDEWIQEDTTQKSIFSLKGWIG